MIIGIACFFLPLPGLNLLFLFKEKNSFKSTCGDPQTHKHRGSNEKKSSFVSIPHKRIVHFYLRQWIKTSMILELFNI
jgi:hypothetical protein